MDLGAVKHIHMIGIGGTGLSAIARVLLESGYQVSGSDRQASTATAQLQNAGARVVTGHAAENVHGAQVVIRSSAVPDDNVEVVEARRSGIPVLKRADFLGALMQEKTGIAVAGTHGKTTTSAMTAWMLTALGLDPSFIIGGVSQNLGVNAHAGTGRFFVIEADEYDRMFHGLRPQTAVVTNIEHDHPDCYPTMADFYQAFAHFTRLVPPDGDLVMCADDPHAARLAGDIGLESAGRKSAGRKSAPSSARLTTYGIDSGSVRAIHPQPNTRGGYTFAVRFENRRIQVDLQVPGLYNVRNALASLVVGYLHGLELERSAVALGEFSGTERRFDILGEAQDVIVIDDYGHHPSEIQATLVAARARYPERSLWATWQPHTYSRTRALFSAFSNAFQQADHVVVTEIFASREQPPADGFSSQQVVDAMQHPDARYIAGLEEAGEHLSGRLKPGDVLIVFSAGDADLISRQVLNTLSQPGTLNQEERHV